MTILRKGIPRLPALGENAVARREVASSKESFRFLPEGLLSLKEA
jgi:hypothetical protein